ncbi:MAG: bacillithiol biosynthesis BshC, partial [Ginsengibacter sp.]
THPENFSPNVILRGIFQEVILPNILFVGGGGELAYWLELKDLFSHYRVPFPVLVLRNSFLLIEKRFLGLMQKLKLSPEDLFSDQLSVLNRHVKAASKNGLALDVEKKSIEEIFRRIREKTRVIDSTLAEHTSALQTKAIKDILSLEKKMIRAERRKFSDTKNQLSTLHAGLFPAGNLQERTENFMLFYSKWGPSFIDMLYQFSLSTEQEFCVIEEKK